MNLQERINEFTNNIIKYAQMRKDRSANVFCLSNLYNSLCANWNNVIPDLTINRMLDGTVSDEDVFNALLVGKYNEGIMSSIEIFTKLVEEKGPKFLKEALSATE